MKSFSTLFVSLFILLVIGCKSKNDSPAPTVKPAISAITPLYGLPGTMITVSGTGFTDLTSYQLKVNGTAAVVTPISDTEVTFNIPDGSSTGSVSLVSSEYTTTSSQTLEVLVDFPRTGLVAFYPFNGNANDVTSNALNGVLSNFDGDSGPTTTSDRFGSAAHAYAFNGVADYIRITDPNSVLAIQNALTLSAWINISEVKNQILLTRRPLEFPSNPCTSYQVDVDIDGSISTKSNIFIETTTASESFSGSSITGTSVWTLLTIVIDGTQATTYINGDASSAKSATVDALGSYCSADLVIGASWNATGYPNSASESFHGSIDDFMIYNRALSADEVQKLYLQTATKY